MNAHGNGHDAYAELIPLHAFGALEGEDRARLEAHLAEGCDACGAELGRAQAVADDLLRGAEPVRPTPAARARLFERVREDARRPEKAEPSTAPRRARSRAWLPLALAASLVLAVGVGLYARSLRNALQEERNTRMAMSAHLDLERRAREEAEARVAAAQQAVDALTSPGTRAVMLAGLGPAPAAKAKAFLVPDRGELLLFVYDLPPLPPGRTYQLWVIAGKKPPVSAGTFEVLPDGSARFDARAIPPLEGKVTVAVTQEPAGGVPQPTGPMVLAGS